MLITHVKIKLTARREKKHKTAKFNVRRLKKRVKSRLVNRFDALRYGSDGEEEGKENIKTE